MKKYYYKSPTFKLLRGSWDPTFKLLKGGSRVPLLNLEGVPGPEVADPEVPRPGVLVLLLHHALPLVHLPSLQTSITN